MRYHVTIERQLIRAQTQTISVEATDAMSAYKQAIPLLDPAAWNTEPYEMIGDAFEVECTCDNGGWSCNFVTSSK